MRHAYRSGTGGAITTPLAAEIAPLADAGATLHVAPVAQPNPFSQESWPCRCEWGPVAPTALAPADVTIVIDVLSFTTCVDVATSRGVVLLPFRWSDWSDPALAEFARAHHAEPAGKRNHARYTLAPESYLDAPAGLRVALPSPNGAMVSLAAAPASRVLLAGCLRNARAVAAAAARLGTTFNVVPAGERWPDGSLRPALEDLLGAGAILSHLPGNRSPDARAAVTVFDQYKDSLAAALADSASGRELDARGHLKDKEIAAQLNVSETVPKFDGDAFVAS